MQDNKRKRMFAAHQGHIDDYFDADGTFCWQDRSATGGYRGLLFHCLSYLAGDAQCVERANKIITVNFVDTPCHFAPCVALSMLHTYRQKLAPETISKLMRLLELNVPYMSTEDLKIHGYNDNHVYKAIFTLVVGGELLGVPHLVERGLFRLRQAREFFQRTGFPCEYNSPNYAPVSLQPLASLVEHTQNEEARDLGLMLERFYWQDVALHFDPNAGLPTGPMTRAGDADATGLIGGTTGLISHLFGERFAFDVAQEIFSKNIESELLAAANKELLPFSQANTIWNSFPNYHFPASLEDTLFDKTVGACVRGTAESGTSQVAWATDSDRPIGAPDVHRFGPRNSLLTTYYGDKYTLGTSQYSWLDGRQTHSFYATIARGRQRRPQDAAVYYSRLYFDDHSPYSDTPRVTGCFADDGEIRTIQHEGAALVFYNPYPIQRLVKQIRVGVLRPILFNRPNELWVGDNPVASFNAVFEAPQPIAIDEGDVYVGIIPIAPTSPLQSVRKANLVVHDRSTHLVIESTLFESWAPVDLTYEQLVEICGGFVYEIQPAGQYESFRDFREWLASGHIEDDYFARMRTTTYRREGLSLSGCYSPWTNAFRHASINGCAVTCPTLQIDGLNDPGYAICGK